MSGPATPYSIALTGLFLIVAALHPFGPAPWLLPAFRRSNSLATVVFFLGIIGVGYCVYGAVTGDHASWWLFACIPALVYWLLMTGPAKKDTKKKTGSGAKEAGNA